MISLSPVNSAQEVAPVWQKLCADIPHSFFLSWPWIENLLECSAPLKGVKLLTIGADPISAAALLFESTVSRRHVLRVRTVALNTHVAGHQNYLSPEHTGLLVHPDLEMQNWDLFLDHLSQDSGSWDEVGVEAATPALALAWQRRGWPLREEQRSKCRITHLEPVRKAKDSTFLNVLSSRARSRVRSTARGMQERYGAVTVEIAASAQQADEFFSELKVLHERRWREDPTGGAFTAPNWERFQRRFIARNFAAGIPVVSRVRAGERTLGVLYYFLHQGRVHFYQSGIDYEAAVGSESPGILIHAAMIDHFAAQGHEVYDFMAGDSQYKRTLATDSIELWWGALQAPRLSLRTEALARQAYRAVKARLRKAAPAAAEK